MENNNKEMMYPRFISNRPHGTDLFEGKSQEKIADRLSQILCDDTSCKIIGIDGGWGSGKSNVVRILENKLESKNFIFFIYDAWGYQEDLQRRSILEAMTSYLTERKNILEKEKWAKKLKNLLARKRETTTATIPKLSIGIIISVLALILTPILNIATEHLNNYLQLSIVSLPILTLLVLIISYWFNEKSIKKAISKAFFIYQDKQIENITNETVSEEEPTAREFRNWIQEVSDDLINHKLVLVFDNMDRLSADKVQQLWSSIHLFFAETNYENISVIIPFDRQHIINAFRNEDTDDDHKICYGNDFIDKTFNVVYRVSPPILSDWRKFIQEKYVEAFGDECDIEECEKVLQIYGLLSPDITPRRIIAFINEIVSIKHIQNDIPERYIALFILAKETILNNPTKEIITPSYLGSTDFIYKNDDDLPKYIGALTYQIQAETALQVIYTEKLKQALDKKDSKTVEIITESPSFESILVSVLPLLDNIGNAILCLFSLDGKISQSVWDNLYFKIGDEEIENQKIKDYQLQLIEKTKYKKEYIQKLLKSYLALKEFDPIDYYNSITEINNSSNIGFSIFDLLNFKVVPANQFVAFVEKTQDEFSKYKVICVKDELDAHLSAIEDIVSLDTIRYIPFLVKEKYPLNKFEANLRELIKSNKDDIGKVYSLYSRLKETSGKPIKKNPLEDADIHSLFTDLTENDKFYYDLIAMRIARFNSFQSTYKSYFEDILKESSESLINGVAEVIEYYTTYGELLLNIDSFADSELYKGVVKRLMTNPVGVRSMTLSASLKKFNLICEKGNIEPIALIEDLNKWMKYKGDSITLTNIKTVVPDLSFFKNAININNELTEYCITTVKEYLNQLKIETWSQLLEDTTSYEVQLSLLFQDYEYTPEAIDAIKNTLERIAKSELEMKREDWEQIVSKLKSENRYTVFRDIRDLFCSTIDIDSSMFYLLGDWLFEYGNLEERKESRRRILKSEIVRDEDNREIIAKHSNKLIEILKNTETNEVEDFKSTIRSLLDNDAPHTITIAKEIGVRKSKKKEEVESEDVNEK